MTDEPTTETFPDAPAVKYGSLKVTRQKEILAVQITAFEEDMFGHQANYSRLRDQYDALDAADPDREILLNAAQTAVAAIETIKSAIDSTRTQLADL